MMKYDWPDTGLQWFLYGGGFFLAFVYTIWLYVLDTRERSLFWRFWLLFFRLSTLAIVLLIALNPYTQDRKAVFSPSRVILVVDTSLSMREPEKMLEKENAVGDKSVIPSRSSACVDLLEKSSLIEDLRKKHDVYIYTFDTKLKGPHRVFSTYDVRLQNETLVETKQSSDKEDVSKDKDTSKEQTIDWKELLRPQGTESALGEAVRELVGTVNDPTLAGVVVISDGGSNAGIDPSSAAVEAKEASPSVHIYTVGVGSTLFPKRLQITDVEAPSEVHVGKDPYDIKAYVQGVAMGKDPLMVELLMRPEADSNAPLIKISEQKIQLDKDNTPIEVVFNQIPKVAGKFEYVVRTYPLGKSNHSKMKPVERSKIVSIVKRNLSVLMIAGGPTRDYRFARNMLYRHPGIDIDVWLQTVDPSTVNTVSQESDDLLVKFPENFPLRPKANEIKDESAQPKQYDVILAFDVDWERIDKEGREKIKDWVDRKSGGIVFIAGDVYTPDLTAMKTVDGNNKFESILLLHPVVLSDEDIGFRLDEKAVTPSSLNFTQMGKSVGFLQLTDEPETSKEVWKEFEGIYRCYPTKGKKAGAQVYSYFSGPNADGEEGDPIFLASQYYGSGKAMYVGSGEIWRLRSIDDEFFDRFWTKVIREVGQGRQKQGNNLGMSLPEKNTYYLGESIQMRVQMMTPQLKPLILKSAKMKVITPDGREMAPVLTMIPDPQNKEKGQYISSFRANELGIYRVEVPVSGTDEVIKERFEVLMPTLETDDPRQNITLLTELSHTTSGKYFTMTDVKKELPTRLEGKSQETYIDEQPQTQWDRMFLMWLLLGLLGIEWLSRKLLKLA